MRLKKDEDYKQESGLKTNLTNNDIELQMTKHLNQVNDQSSYSQNIIKKINSRYRKVKNQIRVNSNDQKDNGKNKNSVFSTDEKQEKAMSFIENCLNGKNKENFIQTKYGRNSYNSFNNLQHIQSEDEFINDNSSNPKIYIEINPNNSEKKQNNIMDNKESTNLFTPKKSNDLNNKQNNIYNNQTKKKNIDVPKIKIPTINQKQDNYGPKSITYRNKKFDKKCNINKFIKNLRLINQEDKKTIMNENNLTTENRGIKHENLLIRSPKASSSNRQQHSPINDILSKSNNLFINKIPNENNNIDLSYEKKSLTKRLNGKPDISFNNYNSNSNYNCKTLNPSNSNRRLLNANSIYRNKKMASKFHSISMSTTVYDNKYNRSSQSLIIKNNEKAIENENKNIFNKYINKKNEELKKEIIPINYNQFTNISYINNNYKNYENINIRGDNTKGSPMNKNFNSLNKSQEFNYKKKIVNMNNRYNNSTYSRNNNLKLKDNFNNNNDKLTICYRCNNKEKVIPINTQNLDIINTLLKDLDLQIIPLKHNKLLYKKNEKMKKKTVLSGQKYHPINNNKEIKNKFGNNFEVKKQLPKIGNKKQILCYTNTERKKIQNFKPKKDKNEQIKLKKQQVRAFKSFQIDNNNHNNILNNFEEIEKKYQNKNLKEIDYSVNREEFTPNFKSFYK